MPRLAANLSMLFTERPLLDRMDAAARAGFKGVEIQLPYAETPEALAARLTAAGLELVMFNLPCGDWDKGERGIACLPGREDEFHAGVLQAISYARVIGVRKINCLAGIAPAPDQASHQTLVSNLRHAAAALAAEGITLLVEAVNTRDVPGFALSTSRQTFAVIDEVGLPNVAMQYDVYHMQVMEGDLLTTIERNLPRIGHIQIADPPGRFEPGTGEVNFDILLPRLDALGYAGWVGCEYKPRAGTEAGLGWASKWLTGGR